MRRGRRFSWPAAAFVRAIDEGPRSTSHAAAARDTGDRVDGPVTGPPKQTGSTRTAHSQSIAPRGCSLSDSLISFRIAGEGLTRRRSDAWSGFASRSADPRAGSSDGLQRIGRRSQLGRRVSARRFDPSWDVGFRETFGPSRDVGARESAGPSRDFSDPPRSGVPPTGR